MGWILFALLIGVPLIEIYLFVEIGGLIGTWPTIGLVVLTAIAGSVMLRAQGRQVLARAQEKINRGEPPVADLLDGIGLLLAGALLLPAARRWLAVRLWTAMQARGSIHVAGFGPGRGGGFGRSPGDGGGTVIDGEFETVEPDAEAPDPPGDTPRIGPR